MACLRFVFDRGVVNELQQTTSTGRRFCVRPERAFLLHDGEQKPRVDLKLLRSREELGPKHDWRVRDLFRCQRFGNVKLRPVFSKSFRSDATEIGREAVRY